MNNIKTLGIDIAKTIFQLHGVDHAGKCVLKKRLSRKKLNEFVANLMPCTILMEACGGANYWARQFTALGHTVRLISPQFVKPFVKSNKNDSNDAEGLVEAGSRPSMRFVSPKTVAQQDIQAVHRIRERLMTQRTALMNQMRGLLLEYGIAIPQSQAALRRHVPLCLEEAENELTTLTRELINTLFDELLLLGDRIAIYDKKLDQIFKSNEACQRIAQIEGVGPVTATAIVSDLGNPRDFKNGRHYAAYLGLVPRQHSSGHKQHLLGISKRGDNYLRKLLVHGGRSALLAASKKQDKKSQWLQSLKERRGFNRACVALANKNARTIWALLAHQATYQANYAVGTMS